MFGILKQQQAIYQVRIWQDAGIDPLPFYIIRFTASEFGDIEDSKNYEVISATVATSTDRFYVHDLDITKTVLVTSLFDDERQYRFGFNGMEKDNETYGEGNAYDFGARIYDPRLGRWLSLDPLMSKYPNISPYVYTANNPIIYKDFDGKDYVLVIDHKAKTITVAATYYVTEGDVQSKAAAASGVKVWNSASGVYSYNVNGESYTINFDLKVKEVKDPIAAANADASGNSFVVNDLIVEANEQNGVDNGNTDGKHIQVRTSRVEETDPHEIGHTLGLGHFFKGFMSAASGALRSSMKVNKGYIQKILNNTDNIGFQPNGVGGESDPPPPDSKVVPKKDEDESQRPKGFINGEVERTDGNKNYIDN